MTYFKYDFDELEIELLRALKKLLEKENKVISINELLKQIDSNKINRDNILKILYWLKN